MIARMLALPQALYRAEDVRELDRLAIERHGISGFELMSRAGAALFRALRDSWPEARRVTVVCGAGNNGGDGFVAARLAYEAGMAVTVLMPNVTAPLRGDARLAFQTMQAAGLKLRAFSSGVWPAADVVVDALFGTGLDRELGGIELAAVTAMNEAGVPIISADIPSGLHADTGRILGNAVRACKTVSFIGLKRGMFTGDGRDCCGEILFDDLGVPTEVQACVAPAALRILDEEVADALPPRARNAHKGNYGHVLIAGGNHGMAGAARMAAQAALRVGAGLASIATRPEHAAVVAASLPEAMSYGVASGLELRERLGHATVVAIGPGLGLDAWGRSLFDAVLDSKLPLIVDADALNLLARDPLKCERWVLTPHPGEAARLLGCSAAEIQADRFAAVDALRARYGGTVVLKGAGSLILGAGEALRVCDAGNPGMASGGMGDVLTGVIAGLAAQGLPLTQAAWLGVHLHARAGDEAARDGERGMLAGDVMAALRRQVNPRP